MQKELSQLRSDLRRAWPSAGRVRLLWYIMVDSGTQAVTIVRIQQSLTRLGLAPLAKIFRRVNLVLNSIDWVEGASAGPGLVIRHPVGIVVGHRVQIGEDATLLQGVTLGQRRLASDADTSNPCLGDRVQVGANAIVVGGVFVGDDSVVGAGCVLTKSIGTGVTVVGNPAREVRSRT